VKKFIIVFVCCIIISLPSRQQNGNDSTGQQNDSLSDFLVEDSFLEQDMPNDSLSILPVDSVAIHNTVIQKREMIEAFQHVLSQHPFLSYYKKPGESNLYVRKQTDNETRFYFLIVLLLYFACIRLFFGKYLENLTTLFFRVTMRHQQIREQLLQAPLPSLLLNILFVISCGLYLSLLAGYYNFTLFGNFWLTLLYAIGFVSGIYLGKYLLLVIAGWVFNIRSATGTYIFIVFLVNKMIGIFLLPMVILLSFPNQYLLPVLIPLSYVVMILLLVYRFLNSFRPIRSEIKLNRFHFFLYLCAFEIAPILLIYKMLLTFVERSN